jgi:hypothetical protein
MSGTVTFTENGTTICVASVVPAGAMPPFNGTASCTTGPVDLSVGSHDVVATYSGDAYFLASGPSNTITHVVNKADSTTNLVSSENPAQAGTAVTFTATVVVTPPTAPTGTVTFIDDGVNIPGCVNVPLTGTTAQCTTSSLPVGTHAITAQYSGDGNYNGSTSAAVNQEITAPQGSLDGNATIDAVDLALLANLLAGNICPGDGSFTSPLSNADVNNDCVVNAVDLNILANALVGNPPGITPDNTCGSVTLVGGSCP